MADEKKVGQDVVNFIKSSYESTIENITKMQDQGEKVLKEMMSKSKEVQADGEKVLDEFLSNAKKGRDEFKKLLDENFKRLEDIFK
jgi:polyhydroxyalkanoate synthesis regulator phasin